MKTSPTLQVSELFYSIQGESTYAGFPCLFIRLAGCNLRCSYCDAKYTYEEEGQEMSLARIRDFVKESDVDLVEITGGEPLLQDAVYPLMQELIDDGRTVLLETNGSINLEKVPGAVVKIVDIKCPGSGMEQNNRLANLDLLRNRDELKFVLGSREDYLWALDFLKKNGLYPSDVSDRQRPQILFSPVVSSLTPADLAKWILEDHLLVRLQLQLHTRIWPDTTRGV